MKNTWEPKIKYKVFMGVLDVVFNFSKKEENGMAPSLAKA